MKFSVETELRIDSMVMVNEEGYNCVLSKNRGQISGRFC